MKIGYLGPEGTFSQQAAQEYAKNLKKETSLLPYSKITDVLKAVDEGEIEEGIVPFENSIEGTVNNTIDSLIFDVNTYIKAEIVIPICHNLMTKKEWTGLNAEKIYSHPQSLAQCRKFIDDNFPNAETIPVLSNAEAARIVHESNEPCFAISPKTAADIYSLSIVQESIQDVDHNETRFFVVSKEDTTDRELKKSSLVFSTMHKPGELYRLLDILSIWDINMSKIESRPMKNQLGKYIFYIDIECEDFLDRKDALKMLERKTDFFKHLGTYEVYK